jgi:hypothetical protein
MQFAMDVGRDFSVDIYRFDGTQIVGPSLFRYMLNNQQPAPFTVYSFNLDLPMTPAAVYGISFSNPSGAGLLDIYDGGALLAKGGADGQTYVPLAGTADISNLRLDFRDPMAMWPVRSRPPLSQAPSF